MKDLCDLELYSIFYLYIILNILYYCCSLLLLHSDCTYFCHFYVYRVYL